MPYLQILLLAFMILPWSKAVAQTKPVELGEVNWLRDINLAQQRAKEQSLPILILFQEVPGCLTCQRYGQKVLSHPLIVESIESNFVPLAIFNNKGGKDEEVLKYYQEPSWNNPVLRVVDSQRRDIHHRYAGHYSPADVTGYLLDAIRICGDKSPEYLAILHKELTGLEKMAQATFGMHCFWTGEKELGAIEGVLHTEAGFMKGGEVVHVYYDPDILSIDQLIVKSQEVDCADRIFLEDKDQQESIMGTIEYNVTAPSTFTPDREPKYYLSRTLYAAIPMSPMQGMRANVLIANGTSPEEVLSPLQIRMLKYINEHPEEKWKNLIQNEQWKYEYFRIKSLMKESNY